MCAFLICRVFGWLLVEDSPLLPSLHFLEISSGFSYSTVTFLGFQKPYVQRPTALGAVSNSREIKHGSSDGTSLLSE